MRLTLLNILIFVSAQAAFAGNHSEEILIKVSPKLASSLVQLASIMPKGTELNKLPLKGWIKVKLSKSEAKSYDFEKLSQHPDILHIQPDYKVSLLKTPGLAKLRSTVRNAFANGTLSSKELTAPGQTYTDNPAFPKTGSGGQGPDPLLNSQWGMLDIGVKSAWKNTKGSQEIIVAVIDTGVDYTHEDLIDNIWQNPGEMGTDTQGRDKSSNGIDDDGNGYIDDFIGWDFATNDNKPYDLRVSDMDLLSGGNPGHGTHCAGNVAARGDNGKGIAGVAPNVKIMAIRFLTEKGQGTTSGAVDSIMYAVNNGAQVLSNSWGSEGEGDDGAENKILKDAVRYAESKGAIFVAAAGNGHSGKGYDNDTDAKPGYPASYDMDIIISVAAIDSSDQLGPFSNWGAKTVDIGAPGVKVFSTMVNNIYSDKVMSFFGQDIFWDGTSMATPHVAGAIALYWSLHRNKSWQDVKQALLTSAANTSSLSSKVSSGGKLDVDALMKF